MTEPKSNGGKIIEGLRDAVRHAKGEDVGVRVRHMSEPHEEFVLVAPADLDALVQRLNEGFEICKKGERIGPLTAGYCGIAMFGATKQITALRKALAATPTQTPPDREAVARILNPKAFIDQDAFVAWRWGNTTHKPEAVSQREMDAARIQRQWREEAFAKADQILALFNAPPQKADGWLPIESAPRDGTHFFVTCRQEPRSKLYVGHWWVGLARFNPNSPRNGQPGGAPYLEFESSGPSRPSREDITLWQPLPAPPHKDVM